MVTKARIMPKILVVDDEPDAVELVEFNLKAAGFEVVSAVDGEEALRKARGHVPDLVVLDLMLPEVDGLEVCKILRRDPATSGIPMLMLTAKAAEIDRVLGLELRGGGGLHDQAVQSARAGVAGEEPVAAGGSAGGEEGPDPAG